MTDTTRRLDHILTGIDRIQSRTEDVSEEQFRSDELLQVWVVHHLQVIGEACRSLPDDVRDAHPEVPWRNIVGMRHYLVHEYFRVDLDTTWNVVEEELPDLRRQVEDIRRQLADRENGPD